MAHINSASTHALQREGEGSHKAHGHGHAHTHDHAHHDHDHDDHGDDHSHAFDWLTGIRIAVALFACIAIWFEEAFFFSSGSLGEAIHEFFLTFNPWPVLAFGDLMPQPLRDALPPGVVQWIDYYLAMPFDVYAYFTLFFSGWPILSAAAKDLVKRRMTMELSMTIAIAAGAYTGYFFVTAIVAFFVLIAEVLEGMTVERGRRAIRDLLEFLPRNVTVRRDGQVREIDVDDLTVGETVLVAPGGRIPVDGDVAGGYSFVDESRITGESMPVEKVEGMQVFAGSINQSGALEVRVERIGADTSYGKIIEAVEQAERSRAPISRTSDRLAGYIVLFAIGFALATQWAWHDVNTSISVLVVAGACGVAAGTPLAILGAIGRAARLGAIVKGGAYLEGLYRLNTVVLDKTGTLTFGTPRVTALFTAAGVTDAELLGAAASAEIRSEHPLGKAIIDYARATGEAIAEPGAFRYTPGRGIAATVDGKSVLVGNRAWMEDSGVPVGGFDATPDEAASDIYVARDGKLLGAIAVADTVRPEARAAVEALHKKGIQTILLTGDNPPVAHAIARELGISEVEANMLPENKVERVRKLVAEGRVVGMVGDGVNDAPALAEANVGIAMGSGTDVARESADVVLLGNDLARFVETLDVARWTRRIIYQNFIGTVAVDVLGVIAALIGLIGPVFAIQIHTISELVFIANSTRLLPRKWDPFRPWRELYNSWNLIAQWGVGIFSGAIVILIGSYIVLLLNPDPFIERAAESIPNKAHAIAQGGITFALIAALVSLVVFVAGMIRQRAEHRIAAPAE